MKFRIIHENDEIIVLTEDGGIACIRQAEDIDNNTPREAVTDYYQSLITDFPDANSDDLFEFLAEGKMYCKDWASTPYNSLKAIQDALDWLCLGQTEWEMTDTLFTDIFGN